MNEQEKPDKTRRNLVIATSAVGAAASVGAAVPFAASMWPSERARAAGAPVDVDLARIEPGELAVFEWRGKPVWVLKRTKEMLASLKAAEPRLSDPSSRTNTARSTPR
jgi:ubiquinol-cytochrome c reductase iron-sulfur subunit